MEQLNNPLFKLVMVGKNPYDNYDEYLNKRWGKWIVYLPRYAFEDMPRVVSAAHVVVVPQRDSASARAQFPLKLTDGMAMAKPIIATDVGDIRQILGGGGYVILPNSPEALLKAMQDVYSNYEEAIEKAKLARKRSENDYSIEAMAKALRNVLNKIGC